MPADRRTRRPRVVAGSDFPSTVELAANIERLMAHREDDQRAAAALNADVRRVLDATQEIRSSMATSSQVRDVDERVRELQARVERFEPELQALTNNAAKRSEVEALEGQVATCAQNMRDIKAMVEERLKPLEDARSRASAVIWLVGFVGAGGFTALLGTFIWWVVKLKS